MRRRVNRALALVLLLVLIGSSATAASLGNLLSLAKEQKFKVTEKALKSGTKYALSYAESSVGADKLSWTSDKKQYSISVKKASAKQKLRKLYVDFSRLYKWKAISYKLDRKLLYGFNVKGAKKTYKSLSACRKGIKAYVQSRSGGSTASANPGSGKYKLNTNSRVFHTNPGCGPAKRMSAANTAYSDKSYDQLIASGYRPCGNCFR